MNHWPGKPGQWFMLADDAAVCSFRGLWARAVGRRPQSSCGYFTFEEYLLALHAE
jgi:hypothetical protein